VPRSDDDKLDTTGSFAFQNDVYIDSSNDRFCDHAFYNFIVSDQGGHFYFDTNIYPDDIHDCFFRDRQHIIYNCNQYNHGGAADR